MRLLIAEDEPDLSEALMVFFEKNQFTVDAVHDGSAAYDYACTGSYDAVILDIMMPKMDGIQVLRRLREDGVSTPIMMLTAKAEKDDRIVGFDAGADDYLPKPFAPDELLSRVRAMLRRRQEFVPEVLTCGDVTLNLGSFQLACGDKSAVLPKMEYRLMETLMRNQGLYLSSEDLLVKVWGYNAQAEIGTVWVYISYLRKRLAALGSRVTVKARRGVGYTLEAGG